jgi:hypothetical protein
VVCLQTWELRAEFYGGSLYRNPEWFANCKRKRSYFASDTKGNLELTYLRFRLGPNPLLLPATIKRFLAFIMFLLQDRKIWV